MYAVACSVFTVSIDWKVSPLFWTTQNLSLSPGLQAYLRTEGSIYCEDSLAPHPLNPVNKPWEALDMQLADGTRSYLP